MKDYVEHIILNYNDLDITFFKVNIDTEKHQTENMHRHNYYEVHFSHNEYFTYEFCNKTITLSPKQIIIIPPQTLHKTNYSKSVIPTVVSFVITSSENTKNYKHISESLDNISLKAIDFTSLSNEQLLFLGNSQLYRTFLGNCKLKEIASSFVYEILSLALKNNDFVVDKNFDIMLLIDNLINYPNVTVKEIAKITNYSERQISRLIKQNYKMTLSEIKRRTKVILNEKR